MPLDANEGDVRHGQVPRGLFADGQQTEDGRHGRRPEFHQAERGHLLGRGAVVLGEDGRADGGGKVRLAEQVLVEVAQVGLAQGVNVEGSVTMPATLGEDRSSWGEATARRGPTRTQTVPLNRTGGASAGSYLDNRHVLPFQTPLLDGHRGKGQNVSIPAHRCQVLEQGVRDCQCQSVRPGHSRRQTEPPAGGGWADHWQMPDRLADLVAVCGGFLALHSIGLRIIQEAILVLDLSWFNSPHPLA